MTGRTGRHEGRWRAGLLTCNISFGICLIYSLLHFSISCSTLLLVREELGVVCIGPLGIFALLLLFIAIAAISKKLAVGGEEGNCGFGSVSVLILGLH